MKTYNGEDVRYAHVKLDGHRIEIVVDHERCVTCWTTVDHIVDLSWMPLIDVIRANVPRNTKLVGELLVPGLPVSEVKTAVNEQNPNLNWVCFAVPSMGPDVPLEDVERQVHEWGISFIPFKRLNKVDTKALLREAERFGYEGWVLKEANDRGWYKLKVERTIDLVVMDIKEGNGKYIGLCGAIKGGVYKDGKLIEVASCSGMTDEQREEIWFEDIGRVFEAKYQNVGSKGRLRHPRFKRWREDKKVEACLAEQDPNL